MAFRCTPCLSAATCRPRPRALRQLVSGLRYVKRPCLARTSSYPLSCSTGNPRHARDRRHLLGSSLGYVNRMSSVLDPCEGSALLDAQWAKLIEASERLAGAKSVEAVIAVLRDTAREIV